MAHIVHLDHGRGGRLPVVAVFAASAVNGGIGLSGDLPWSCPTDYDFFRNVTKTVSHEGKKNAVVMGRATWRSIPAAHRPLKGRYNAVLSGSDAAEVREQDSVPAETAIFASVPAALAEISANAEVEGLDAIHVIGGASAYRQVLREGLCDVAYVTSVRRQGCSGDPDAPGAQDGIDADTFVEPELWRRSPQYRLWSRSPPYFENGFEFWFDTYVHQDAVPLVLRTQPKNGPMGAEFSVGSAGVVPSRLGYSGLLSAEQMQPPSAKKPANEPEQEVVPEAAAAGGGAAPAEQPSGPAAADTGVVPRGALAGRPTRFSAWVRPGEHEEWQYLRIIDDIIRNGVRRGDRTGTGTLSVFGVQMRFSLRNDVLPLLTTKRVFWRGVAEELLWFVAGDTNAKHLQDKKIHIWDGNGSKEFLESIGLGHREEGDLGPVYGFQWRHFGAAYKTCHDDYSGEGVDQLAEVVRKIKEKPTDRRILLTAWNPAALPEMALPPCHMFAQFYVANGELSCQMYQRSADMGLGVPFNIASYALLTRLLAQVCGLKAGDFVHCIGDAHVYLNHVDALKEQLKREPRAFPTLTIAPEVDSIDGFKYEDFTVTGYSPHKRIKMEMAV